MLQQNMVLLTRMPGPPYRMAGQSKKMDGGMLRIYFGAVLQNYGPEFRMKFRVYFYYFIGKSRFVVLCSHLFLCIRSVRATYTDILHLLQINTTEIDIKHAYEVLCG